jgi:hypothetical protein
MPMGCSILIHPYDFKREPVAVWAGTFPTLHIAILNLNEENMQY